MSIRRVTCLIASKIPRSLTYSQKRATHFLTANLGDDNHSRCEIRYVYQPQILTSDLSLLFPTCKRYKSGKKKTKDIQEEDSEDELDDDELTKDSNAKVNTVQISSMRVDLIVKTCLGMARNKAEVAMYESRIRINGEKVLKKSKQVCIGDAIDLIRGPSPKNPDFLLVSRITILAAVAQNDAVRIKFTKDKSLIIENYDDEWKAIDAPQN